jgi:hypothetical protein
MKIVKMTTIVAVGWLAVVGTATRVTAADFCVLFPLGIGPEEVCASGVFPSDPIHVGPGDAVVLPLVEYVNDTDRDMTFTIEAVGSVISSAPHSVTLAPGEAASFTHVVLLTTDALAPIGTFENIQVGWSAFGTLAGEDDFAVTIQRDIQFLVGPDSDGDGLVDSWEADGYDPDDDGVVDIDLLALGADPMHKDLFLEIDWEAAIPPRKTSLDEVRQAFAAAPIDAGGVVNPDGLPGIDVHFDTGSLTDGLGNLVGDPEFAAALGRGTQIPDGPWVFGSTCFGGLDDGRACHPVDNPCDLATEGDALGVCEVGYYRAKAEHFDFFPRRFIFRYVIMNLGAGAGQGELGGDDIWLGSTSSATLMHEMGHTLNLSHGGPPNENGVRNCEPNYLSIMNYRYPRIMRTDGSTHIDFSPAQLLGGARAQAPLDDLNEMSLAEEPLDATDVEHVMSFVGPPEVCSALCTGGPRDGRRCAGNADCENGTCGGIAQEGQSCTSDAQCGGGRCGGRGKSAAIGQTIDWNQNGVLGEAVSQNIDGTFTAGGCGNEGFAAELTVVTGHDDWANIRLRFRPSNPAANAPVDPVLEPELTDAEIAETLEAMSTADLAIAKLGPAGPLEAETFATLAYDLFVSNGGPTFAGTVRVRDQLPAGFSLVDLDQRCMEAEAGVVECETTAFLPGDQTTFSLQIEGTPICRDGLPAAIENVATVENASEFAGDDPDPDDNVAVFATEVVDTTPPVLTVKLSPATLWPANHKLHEITATLAATDACDGDPAIRLVSVISDEPDDAVGSGDGNTTGDIQGADLGAADTSVLLRAERSGKGDGRTYTLTYEAEDRSGNVTSVSKTVTVPKSRQ